MPGAFDAEVSANDNVPVTALLGIRVWAVVACVQEATTDPSVFYRVGGAMDATAQRIRVWCGPVKMLLWVSGWAW